MTHRRSRLTTMHTAHTAMAKISRAVNEDGTEPCQPAVARAHTTVCDRPAGAGMPGRRMKLHRMRWARRPSGTRTLKAARRLSEMPGAKADGSLNMLASLLPEGD